MQTTTLKVAGLAREGMSDLEIAETLGLAVSTAAKLRQKAGLYRSLKRWLAEATG